jgi:hypothetical protein
MDHSRGERRAETAKRTDDSGIIDAAEKESLKGALHQGSEGGNLQTDLGSRADQARTADPSAHESVTKGDHSAHGQGGSPPRPAERELADRE